MKRVLGTALGLTIILGLLLSGVSCSNDSAEFTVSSLSITPEEPEEGETVTIEVRIRNSGSAEGTYTAELKINNSEVETKQVTLSAGKSKKVFFTVTEDAPGTYNVKVDELTGTFEVKPAPAQSVSDYVDEIGRIMASYSHALQLDTNSINDASELFEKEQTDLAFYIWGEGATAHAEETKRTRDQWDAITPPKEFADCHACLSDALMEQEQGARLLASTASAHSTEGIVIAVEARIDANEHMTECAQEISRIRDELGF